MNPRRESPKRRSPTGGRRLAPFEALSAAEVLERIDEGFYSLDREWRLTYANQSAERFWGKKRRQLLGKSMFQIFPRFRGSESHAAHERAMKTGKLVRVRAISTATGTAVELSIFPIAEGLAIYFRDVSAEERIEVELRARGEVLTLAEESAGIGVWDIELDTGMVRGTSQYFQILGLPAKDSIPIEEVRKLRHPADGDSVLQGFEAAIEFGHQHLQFGVPHHSRRRNPMDLRPRTRRAGQSRQAHPL